MNPRKILNWMTRGWNPFLLFSLCLFAEVYTAFLPYDFWLRGVLFLPLLASGFLLVETMPGGMLGPKTRQSEKKKERDE